MFGGWLLEESFFFGGYWTARRPVSSFFFLLFFRCFCDGCILAEHSGLCDGVSTTCCAVSSIPEGLRDRQVGLANPAIVMPFGGRMPGLFLRYLV